MRYPYWFCKKCGAEVLETRFPLRADMVVPTCDNCGSKDMDIALFDDAQPLDANKVIFQTKE